MPGQDRTGPLGQGPLTGRQLGKCNGARTQERGFGFRAGLGRRFARGNGRGFRFRANIQDDSASEKEVLEDELEALKQEMNEIQDRLKEINKNSE